jgi:hypothetical protein
MAAAAAIKIETALRKTSSSEKCSTGVYFLLLFIYKFFNLLIFQNCYFLSPFGGGKKKAIPPEENGLKYFQLNPHLPLQPANNRCCGNNGNMDTCVIHNQWNKSSKVFFQTETMI